MNYLKNIFNKLFLVKEITSKIGILHFQRWRLVKTPWFSICLHKLLESDSDAHLHSHPWNFASLILWGGYWEETPDGTVKLFYAGRLNIKEAHKYHRIALTRYPTWTLVFTGKRKFDWGYDVNNKFVDNVTYRELKSQNQLDLIEKSVANFT